MNRGIDSGRTFPTLETDRLLLRETNAMDARQLAGILSESDIGANYGFEVPVAVDTAREVIRRSRERFEMGAAIRWALARKTDNTLLGAVDVRHVNPAAGIVNIGYELAGEHRGAGLMTEAVAAVVDYIFRRSNIYRLEARVDPANTASLALLDRTGFQREGVLRGAGLLMGVRHDLVVFSVLQSDL
ncbi:MAG: GNAT family protein [Chthonomonadales bacterium]